MPLCMTPGAGRQQAQAHGAVGLACLATCSATMASVGLSGMLPA